MTRPACLLALAAVLACGSAVEPDALQGAWYLHAYNDSAVPGRAVFRSGNDSSLIVIDSVRLYLATEFECGWLVHLTDNAPNQATTCIWALDTGGADIVVTIDEGFVLQGEALPALLRLEDPNGNVLQFERDPAVREPEVPDPL